MNSLSVPAVTQAGFNMTVGPPTSVSSPQQEKELLYRWILDLNSLESRETALLELSRKRDAIPELAPLLWNSFGTIAALLQEIVQIYPYIHPPVLSAHQSNRVCHALALLQCVASHPDTRAQFLQTSIPLYLYSFLHTSCRSRPFEYLRLTSLGVIGALVKTDDADVIAFLLHTEIIPLCLRIMETGSELSKTVATFILQKILLDDTGLAYICQTYERFAHVASILNKMVQFLARERSARLLKPVVRCYTRLADNPRARQALATTLPDALRDDTFQEMMQQDASIRAWLLQLRQTLQLAPATQDLFPPQTAN
uniref:CCR4-NOT transcription complex subunit 9 n=2 Tax=Macrostomum lignano TaxID=282301 RepID=A0A1I8GRL1_9PLAT